MNISSAEFGKAPLAKGAESIPLKGSCYQNYQSLQGMGTYPMRTMEGSHGYSRQYQWASILIDIHMAS